MTQSSSFECHSCARTFSRKLSHPPDCLHPERCDIRRVVAAEAVPPTPAEEPDEALDVLLAYKKAKQSEAAENSAVATTKAETPRGQPVLVVQGRNFDLRHGDILGRQGTVAAEVFSVDKSISRRHAMVNIVNEVISLTNLASTGNPVQVNGKVLGHMDDEVLRPGRNNVVFGTRGFTVAVEIP